ncbi:MAG: hypothetical protein C0475_00510 [Planctomyces sp.]|nr:hypothetical protein [Planctomyces sp.]MBA4119379.1 hypothetical protein [Isosphaera sp.]
MITQTWAIVWDTFRELRSRRLWWLTLGLSLLVVGVFGAIGLGERGLTFLWWELETPFLNKQTVGVRDFYTNIFVQFGVAWWLGWLGLILALMSTASIVPDMVSAGSIELVLSKPIGRWRLLLTKYAGALGFVGVQVLVFAAASILVIGVRGGVWLPGLLIAVPLVVGVFSMLYCVCVLTGLLTRSTLAALVITALFWGFVSLLSTAYTGTEFFREVNALNLESQGRRVERLRAQRAALEESQAPGADGDGPAGQAQLPEETGERWDLGPGEAERLAERLREAEAELARVEENRRLIGRVEWWLRASITALPKTGRAIEMMTGWLESEAQVAQREQRQSEGQDLVGAFDPNRGRPQSPEEEAEERRRERVIEARVVSARREQSAWWVLGTSGAFNAAVLLVACWRFGRRDF